MSNSVEFSIGAPTPDEAPARPNVGPTEQNAGEQNATGDPAPAQIEAVLGALSALLSSRSPTVPVVSPISAAGRKSVSVSDLKRLAITFDGESKISVDEFLNKIKQLWE
jgi:hypothetical protein